MDNYEYPSDPYDIEDMIDREVALLRRELLWT